MSTPLIVNFTPSHAGPRWGIELPDGQRVYSHTILCEVPTRFVTIPDQPRDRGYCEVAGDVEWDETVSRITNGAAHSGLVASLAQATGLTPAAVVTAALTEMAARLKVRTK